MARHARKDRERYWRGVIRDQQASGLSISAFCRERQVAAASFFNWRRKLSERNRADEVDDAAAKFIALELSPSSPSTRRPGCEVVLPNGCRLIVPMQCDAGWLREILGALQEPVC